MMQTQAGFTVMSDRHVALKKIVILPRFLAPVWLVNYGFLVWAFLNSTLKSA